MVLWCDPSNLNLNKKNNARKKKEGLLRNLKEK